MSEHSPLGASGAERWMNCPGSVELLKHVGLPESDEEDWTREGTAMHEAAAKALEEDLEPWELVGYQARNGVTLTNDLALPLQSYLDHCRPLMAARRTFGIEARISSPVHPLFFGTADFWALAPIGFPISLPSGLELIGARGNALHIADLKGGQGVMVEPTTPQIPYYAFGVIDTLERQRSYVFEDDMLVVLSIVQPRGFHPDGPVRSIVKTVGEIKTWVHGTLVPAMERTAWDNDLDPGKWCRFCPAKLVCPKLAGLFRTAALIDCNVLPNITDEALGFEYEKLSAVEQFVKALKKEALRRAEAGRTLPTQDGRHVKLVYAKANRQWKPGAKDFFIQKYGDKALTDPELKSPAEMEKLAGAKDFVKAHAFQPRGSLTLALPDDSREEVQVQRLSERYAGAQLE